VYHLRSTASTRISRFSWPLYAVSRTPSQTGVNAVNGIHGVGDTCCELLCAVASLTCAGFQHSLAMLAGVITVGNATLSLYCIPIPYTASRYSTHRDDFGLHRSA
jgi:hypothetical protein